MKAYDEMLDKILKIAQEDEGIRAVTMEGSNTTDTAVHDKYSDFDITFFVSDIREYTKDRNYMDRFGEVLIKQCPDDWYAEPYDYNSRNNFAFLTQYKDGNRIDLTFIDVSNIALQKSFNEPRRVLINKDNYTELVDITTADCFFIKKPTAFEYFNTCNEFRWISNYVTKGLCREEFYYAKRMMEEYMMNMFMKMINWKIGVDHDFKVSTGACSKYLKKYLSEDEMKRFRKMFANGEYDDMWFKLFLMYDYFAELAQYVAQKLGFEFDEKETREVRDFMIKRREDKIMTDSKYRKKNYQVDYRGQKNLFDGAKENYAEGTEVVISYSLIATDTNYTFYVDGQKVSAEWNDRKGYVIRFTMPDHDIEVYCVEKNLMNK